MTQMPKEIWAYKGIQDGAEVSDMWDSEPRVLNSEEREKYHDTKFQRVDDDTLIISLKELEHMLKDAEDWDIFALFSGFRKGYIEAINDVIKKPASE